MQALGLVATVIDDGNGSAAFIEIGACRNALAEVYAHAIEAMQGRTAWAFSCKRRGFCPSCGTRRMVETAALLVDEVPRAAGRLYALSAPVTVGATEFREAVPDAGI